MTSVLLVHGAMHGSWCWDKIVAELRANGVEVRAIDLPGNGVDGTALADATLSAYAQHILSEAEKLPAPRMVVGHSAGGIAISAAVERDPAAFAKAIYLAAILPVDGDEFAKIREKPVEGKIDLPLIVAADGGSFFMDETALPYFCNTCSAEDTAWVATKVTPQPLRPMMEPIKLTPERFGSVEKVYIKCTEDRALPPAMQDYLMAQYPGIRVHKLATDHSPFLSAPAELTAILLQELEI